MSKSFKQRILTGWISEFVNRALPGEWPQIPLDDETLRDFDAYFDLCKECGYTDVVIWGFFVDRRWPVDVASCLDDGRRERLSRLVEAGRSRGLKVLGGLGIYSWGFDAIIEAHPGLSRTNASAMCPSVPESWEWMQKVVDVVMGEVDYDGLNMQSADQGRCECDDCSGVSRVEYHARLNERVSEYIRSQWSDKHLLVDNWGCPFDDPEDLPTLERLSKSVDCIMDHNNSAENAGRAYRKKLAGSVSSTFGTLAGRSIWPPQRWSSDRWFVPMTLMNVDYMRRLHEDGGTGAEQFVRRLGNPSCEVSMRFMGKLMANVEGDAVSMLRDSVEEAFEPASEAALDGMTEVVGKAEAAYTAHACRDLAKVGLFNVDGGLMPKEDPSPESYLLEMEGDHLTRYQAEMAEAAEVFSRVAGDLKRTGAAETTRACFQNVSNDIERIVRNRG